MIRPGHRFDGGRDVPQRNGRQSVVTDFLCMSGPSVGRFGCVRRTGGSTDDRQRGQLAASVRGYTCGCHRFPNRGYELTDVGNDVGVMEDPSGWPPIRRTVADTWLPDDES